LHRGIAEAVREAGSLDVKMSSAEVVHVQTIPVVERSEWENAGMVTAPLAIETVVATLWQIEAATATTAGVVVGRESARDRIN
jgi:hypothetical protein